MHRSNNAINLMSQTYPSPQNAVDIFEGGWASLLPDVGGVSLKAGKIELFNDERILWANEQSGGFKGMNVLELGPLEGGHSYMLQQMGVESVLALEANPKAFLKCLVVKELYNLDRCNFILGDFVKYLKQSSETFDYILASGVLYHMENPAELLALIAKVSTKAMIWSHYYDQAVLQKRTAPWRRARFHRGERTNYQGFTYTRYKQPYRRSLRSLQFWGGTAAYSYWMNLEDILSGLKYFGFTKIDENFHDPQHVNGPSICLCCSKN